MPTQSLIIDDLPAVVAIDEQLVELAQPEGSYLEAAAVQQDAYDAAVRTHDERVDEELAAGKLPPDRPAEPPSAEQRADVLLRFQPHRVG